MKNRLTQTIALALSAAALLAPASPCSAEEAPAPLERVHVEAIDQVFTGNRVHFDFLRSGRHQFVGYYDANRQLTVAQRTGRSPWNFYKVDSWQGWDSHNYIRMALDEEGHLHVMANMHADRLEYFRMRHPYLVRSLERVSTLGEPEIETRMTYPIFTYDDQGKLVFKYRSGGSGNGLDFYKKYDVSTKSWSSLHGGPLLDGEGLMNAYPSQPALGPDGNFHMIWVWRDTPDAATNHDISYARSRDLATWEDSNGKPFKLPLTLGNSEIVDPIPAFGGTLNGANRLAFDSENRPVLSYFKFDENGDTQVFVARKDGEGWKVRAVTDWQGFRWEFGGGGSLGESKAGVGPITVEDGGLLGVVAVREKQAYKIFVNEKTLERVRVEEIPAEEGLPFPEVIASVVSSPDVRLKATEAQGDDLVLQVLKERGTETADGSEFYLSWEAHLPNRDQARGAIQSPGTLHLHEFRRAD